PFARLRWRATSGVGAGLASAPHSRQRGRRRGDRCPGPRQRAPRAPLVPARADGLPRAPPLRPRHGVRRRPQGPLVTADLLAEDRRRLRGSVAVIAAALLRRYLLAVIPAAFLLVLTRAFHARRDMLTPLWLGAIRSDRGRQPTSARASASS